VKFIFIFIYLYVFFCLAVKRQPSARLERYFMRRVSGSLNVREGSDKHIVCDNNVKTLLHHMLEMLPS